MKARRFLAAAILAGYAALHAYGAYAYAEGAMRFCFAFFSVACSVGAAALVGRTFWARRYAMGIGIAGLLNCAAYFGWFHGLGGLWFGVAQAGAFAALVALLLGRKMREYYDDLAPHWQFDHPTMHLLATALSFNVAGVGMLVYYGCLDSSPTAFAIAAVLALGSISAARGRILGLFLMTGAGLASIWLGLHAVETVPHAVGACGMWNAWAAWVRWETFKSVIGFIPAAIASILCFSAFLVPMVRFLRNEIQSHP